MTVADPERTVRNVVIDHCSLSWAVDEVFNSWYDASDITIQRCIFAEGLHFPRDRDSAGSKGVLLGGRGSDGISFHHNLLAHNVGRNPMIKTGGVVDLVNNVLFIPGTVGVVVDGELGRALVNVVGNQLLAPNGDGLAYGVSVLGRRDVSLYVSGNLGPYREREDQPDVQFVDARNTSRQRLTDQRHAAPPVTTSSAAAAFTAVLENAGCIRPMRDAVDERVIADVRHGTARIVGDPAEVGGWPELPAGTPPDDTDHDGMPDDWERRFALDPDDPGDGPRDADGDGYTNVEEFLNSPDPRVAP